MQGKQRLNGLWARLEVTEKQQYHRNGRGNPARHHGHTKQGRQHETDTTDHHVGQSHVVGQTEVFFQQGNHAEADHKHDQRLQHLGCFPPVVHKRQSNLERTAGPERLFSAIGALEDLHE